MAVAAGALVAGAARADIPAPCSAAPPFHPGRLGAVAYLRDGRLHVLDVADGRDRVVARVSEPRPLAWSADGRWISAGNLLVSTTDGHLCRPFERGSGLYGGNVVLHWAPRGDLLAATTARGVFLLHPAGARRRLLPAGWSADGFGPDGGRLVAEAPSRTQTPSLWSVALASGRRTLLYRSPSIHVGQPELARWTRDGRSILFWTDTEDSSSLAADGLPLLAVPAGGGRATSLDPYVLPTSQFVVPCGQGRVLVVSGLDRYVSAHKSLRLFTEGSWSARDLSRDPGYSWFDPTCSPDGSTILATATRMPGDETGTIDSSARMLWRLTPSGTRQLLLGRPHDPVSYEGARFARDGRHVLYLEHATRYGAPLRLRLLDLATGRSGRVLATLGGGDYYGLRDLAAVAPWYQR